jgi:hypothetical protein
MTHQANTGNNHQITLADTISREAIEGIAEALHTGFTSLNECGLPVGKDSLVDDVYTKVILDIAKVIYTGNPAFDSKRFLVRVWESKPAKKTSEDVAEPGNQLAPSNTDVRYGLED